MVRGSVGARRGNDKGGNNSEEGRVQAFPGFGIWEGEEDIGFGIRVF